MSFFRKTTFWRNVLAAGQKISYDNILDRIHKLKTININMPPLLNRVFSLRLQ